MTIFEELQNSVMQCDPDKVKEVTQKAIDAKVNPIEIINDGLIAGMRVIGGKFKEGDVFVPEVLMAAKAMQSGIGMIKPLIAEEDMPSAGKVVMGTVKGDLHDIGKNLVIMMLESVGYEVIDLGVDIEPKTFVEAVKKEQPHVVGMSALLTTTMMEMKVVINSLKEAGVRDDVKVIIGGAPITEKFAEEIGADAYAPDASSASEVVQAL